jgi:hypothetical protein
MEVRLGVDGLPVRARGRMHAVIPDTRAAVHQPMCLELGHALSMAVVRGHTVPFAIQSCALHLRASLVSFV